MASGEEVHNVGLQPSPIPADLLWMKETSDYYRGRKARVTLEEVSEVVMEEIKETFAQLSDGREALDFRDLLKAADGVLGAGRGSTGRFSYLPDLKKAMKFWDLNGNGTIDFFEFRAWWIHSIKDHGQDANEYINSMYGEGRVQGREEAVHDDSMILVGGMRLKDLLG
eukprot:gene21635-28644_t